MENKKKTIMLSLGVMLLLTLVIGATVAYFITQTNSIASSNVKVTSSTSDSLIFDMGSDINIVADLDNFGNTEGSLEDETILSATFRAGNTESTVGTYSYYMYLNIQRNEFRYSQEGNIPELILNVYDEKTNEEITLTNLTRKSVTDNKGITHTGYDITTAKGIIELKGETQITSEALGKEVDTYRVKVTFINLNANQLDNRGKTLDAKVMLTSLDFSNLAQRVIALSSTDTTILHHDTNLENGANDNSYRYTGKNVNNYVCFGSEAVPCPAENLYRIIGAFDYEGNGTYQVKLIQANFLTQAQIGTGVTTQSNNTFYWTGLSSITNNTWENSALYTSLNSATGYLNPANFSNKREWTDKIATTTWNVGGCSWGNCGTSPVTTAYDYEVGEHKSSTTVNAKIGMMYVSDYGYAATPENWTTNMNALNNDTNRNNNWLYSGQTEWTLSRQSDTSDRAFRVNNDGDVTYGNVYGNSFRVRASFNLESTEVIGGGEGTAESPYRIVL